MAAFPRRSSPCYNIWREGVGDSSGSLDACWVPPGLTLPLIRTWVCQRSTHYPMAHTHLLLIIIKGREGTVLHNSQRTQGFRKSFHLKRRARFVKKTSWIVLNMTYLGWISLSIHGRVLDIVLVGYYKMQQMYKFIFLVSVDAAWSRIHFPNEFYGTLCKHHKVGAIKRINLLV